MKSYLITNAQIVNEGTIQTADIVLKDGFIYQIGANLSGIKTDVVIDAKGKYLLPGVIDDQVHFREPGLTHKGEIYTEAKAAVAGGVTSYMEMPNTVPSATTIELLEEKYLRAAKVSLANFSFFIGTTNSNIDELLRVNKKEICGVKIFMGSSTGDMLVDNPDTLERVFSEVDILIATHCEDDPLIKANNATYKAKYGEDVPVIFHHLIRSEQACYNSSSFAVGLAKKHNTKLHILHISTAKELALFDNTIPLKDKRITAEACIHHLWFSNEDYETKGNFIKWNPAVKTPQDREAIFKAVLNDKIDVIATDHAPHTLDEKKQSYLKAPSGGPLIQHSLLAMLDFHVQEKISLPKIVDKMSHNPAILFQIQQRGFIREGYWADIVLVDIEKAHKVEKSNLLYKCGWSPFEGHTFPATVTHTFVSGHLVYQNGVFDESVKGKRLAFDRD
jgi:dihydroorotase